MGEGLLIKPDMTVHLVFRGILSDITRWAIACGAGIPPTLRLPQSAAAHNKRDPSTMLRTGLASVNQRLMSPYFGDLAEWLCKAVGSASRMASSSISNVSRRVPCF